MTLERQIRRSAVPAAFPAVALSAVALSAVALAALTWPAAAAAGESGGAPVDLEQEREAVRQADLALARALGDHDRDRFRSLLDAEAVFLGAEVSRGPDAILETWAPFFDPETGMELEWTPTEVGVAASGELAWSIGDAVMTFRRGRSTEKRPGKYLTAWRKDAEGSWKIIGDGTLVIYPDASEVRDLRRALGGFWPPLTGLGGAVATRFEPPQIFEAASGDVAITIGRYSVEVEEGGESAGGSGGVLTLWKKTRDEGDQASRWVVAGQALSPPK